MLTSRSKKLYTIILFYAIILHSAYSESDNYCADIVNLGTQFYGLRFLGIAGELDFGLINITKTLYCCASEFTTIEWLKDNKPYPWSRNSSSFVVNRDTFNQTLISSSVKMSDSGVYTCIARNGSLTIQRDVKLEVLAPESALSPKMTYATQNSWVRAEHLQSSKLYCEGFVGVREGDDKNPKFSATVTWEKGLTERYLDRAFIDGYRVTQINSHRDGNQIVGSYLMFRDVRDIDLNMYTCRITNGNHRAVEQRAWLLDTVDPEDLARSIYIAIYALTPIFLLVCLGIMFAAASYINWAVIYCPAKEKKAVAKPKTSKQAPEEKNRRILAVYHTNDELLMSKQIIPKFLEMYPFKVTPYTIYDYEKDFDKLVETAKDYDCIMVIMTPSLVGDEWTCERIDLSIKIINKIHKAFICIFTKKLPPLMGKSGQKLKETLRRSEIHIVRRKSLSGKLLKAYLRRMNTLRTTLSKQYSYKKK